jgi:hypothetical protein
VERPPAECLRVSGASRYISALGRSSPPACFVGRCTPSYTTGLCDVREVGARRPAHAGQLSEPTR